jgi:cell division inhibitor SepF
MGVWRKTLVYLGLVEEDDFEEEAAYGSPAAKNPPPVRKLSREELSSVRALPTARPLGQVHIVEPRRFDDAQEIADKFKAGVPVICNLQGLEDKLVGRLTDFSAGLVYAHDGGIHRLAPRLYLLSPADVEVSAEDKRRLASGVFNEF